MIYSMKKLKVLILPSWYPTKEDPVRGIFFKEQAEALSQYVDVALLSINSIGLNNPHKILNMKKDDMYECNGVLTLELNYVNWTQKVITLRNHLYKKMLIEGYKEICKLFGKPDLIHAHVSYPAGYGALILSQKFDTPFMVTEHATFFETQLIQNKCTHKTLKCANYYTAVSGPLKDKIIDAGRKQCEVIPNFVNINKFNYSNKSKNDNSNKFNLINISSMHDKKGIDILLKALHKVTNDYGYTNIHLHLVGKGHKKNDYMNLAAELNLLDICTFCGQVNEKQLIKLMNACNALVISSRKETFGIVGIEAMASGIPVIATRCGGPEDYITPEIGLLIENENVDSLSKGIIQMIEEYDNYDSDVIKKYFYDNYSDKAVCKKIIQTYENIIKTSDILDD